MLKNKNNKEISLELIQKKYNEINENNYEKKNRNNKRIKKEEAKINKNILLKKYVFKKNLKNIT